MRSAPFNLLPLEVTNLAFASAMRAWNRCFKRRDMSERDRVQAALLAYQRQIDAALIADSVMPSERAAPAAGTSPTA